MSELESSFLRKAIESLAGAEVEFLNGWYNNCANRCYYAAFQSTIAAIEATGIRPPRQQWGHDYVQAPFEGQLLYRRKLYSAALRGTLEHTAALRIKADYGESLVTETEADRTLRRTRTFVQTIQQGADIA